MFVYIYKYTRLYLYKPTKEDDLCINLKIIFKMLLINYKQILNNYCYLSRRYGVSLTPGTSRDVYFILYKLKYLEV